MRVDDFMMTPNDLVSATFGLRGHAVYTPKPRGLDTWILRQLRRDARAWWWHKQLRESGRHTESKALERRSIRDAVRTIRRVREEGVEFVRLDRAGDVIYVQFNRIPFKDGSGSEQTSTTVSRPGFTATWNELHFRYQFPVQK